MTKSKDSDHCRTKPFNFVHTLVIDFTTVECDTLFIVSLWTFHCITFINSIKIQYLLAIKYLSQITLGFVNCSQPSISFVTHLLN
jgi:hypothetical protein